MLHTRPSRRTVTAGALIALVLAVLGVVFPVSAASALPAGFTPIAGVIQQLPPGEPGHVVFEQTSDRAIAQFSALGVGAGETLEIRTAAPDAVTVLRVVGSEVSIIAGLVRSNGAVVLVNPNGVVLATGGLITAAGLTLTTGSTASDAAVMAGDALDIGIAAGNRAVIVTQGEVASARGFVALARQVSHFGAATSADGDVSLLAWPGATVDPLTGVTVRAAAPTDDGWLIRNVGTLTAAHGQVALVGPVVAASPSVAHDGISSSVASAGAPAQVTVDGLAIVLGRLSAGIAGSDAWGAVIQGRESGALPSSVETTTPDGTFTDTARAAGVVSNDAGDAVLAYDMSCAPGTDGPVTTVSVIEAPGMTPAPSNSTDQTVTLADGTAAQVFATTRSTVGGLAVLAVRALVVGDQPASTITCGQRLIPPVVVEPGVVDPPAGGGAGAALAVSGSDIPLGTLGAAGMLVLMGAALAAHDRVKKT